MSPNAFSRDPSEAMSITSADTPSYAGSSILRESPPFRSSSRTGPGGADLSLSELYLSDHSEDSPSKPFSLLPRRDANQGKPQPDEIEDVFAGGVGEERDVGDGDATMTGFGRTSSVNALRTREERLLHDLFVLKKLNSSFATYNDALKDTMSSTENVAVQLHRTDRLLDQYVNLLQHTEKNSRLIFNESWEGGGADQDLLEKMHVEAEQKARREQEERERAVQLEQERQEREEEERRAKEQREAKEKDKRVSVTVRGVRGVRGIRARGSERGTSTMARGRIPSTSTRGASSTTAARGVRKS